MDSDSASLNKRSKSFDKRLHHCQKNFATESRLEPGSLGFTVGDDDHYMHYVTVGQGQRHLLNE